MSCNTFDWRQRVADELRKIVEGSTAHFMSGPGGKYKIFYWMGSGDGKLYCRYRDNKVEEVTMVSLETSAKNHLAQLEENHRNDIRQQIRDLADEYRKTK